MKRLKQLLVRYWVLWRHGGVAGILQYRRDVRAVMGLARALREAKRD